MLRALLHDSEALKTLFENVGLFKNPELLEKYVIASEVTVEVLDLFLSRVFGTERASMSEGSGDMKALLKSLGCFSLSDRKGNDGENLSTRADEPEKEMEGLRVKVQDMERQLHAVQRQLQMQGQVSQLVGSLDSRLDGIARECKRQVSDVRSHVAADVVRLEKEVSEKASNGDVQKLSQEISRLKEGERSLGDRIAHVEKEASETKRALVDEIQDERLPLLLIPDDPLDGAIAHLTRECGGNVHKKGVVEVTASGCCWGPHNELKNAVELGTNTWFGSKNEPNSWICYDFKESRVEPTSYSIRSARGSFPRSWVFEVSNDGKEWKVADRRDNNSELNARCVTRMFDIRTCPGGRFRFVRLLQTGKNSYGNDELWLSSLEVFGTLYSK